LFVGSITAVADGRRFRRNLRDNYGRPRESNSTYWIAGADQPFRGNNSGNWQKPVSEPVHTDPGVGRWYRADSFCATPTRATRHSDWTWTGL